MKKILACILILLASVTMYFVIIWEPNGGGLQNETSVESWKEEKDSKESIAITEEEKGENLKEVENTEKERKKKERELRKLEEEQKKKDMDEIEKNRRVEIENNKKKLEDLRRNINLEDKKIINKKLEELSTTDFMKVEGFLKEGEIEKAKEIVKMRMLESDWREMNKILEKYKK